MSGQYKYADLEAQEYRDRGFVYRIEALERANKDLTARMVKAEEEIALLRQPETDVDHDGMSEANRVGIEEY